MENSDDSGWESNHLGVRDEPEGFERLYFVADSAQQQRDRSRHGRPGWRRESPDGSELGDADDARSQGRSLSGADRGRNGADQFSTRSPNATNGFWSDAEWLPCIDGKARQTKPGLFPLVDGYPNRVGILRAAGNAIVPQAAAAFIAAYMSVAP